MKYPLCLSLAMMLLLCFVVLRADPLAGSHEQNALTNSRVDDLFGRLTQDEKLSMLTGDWFTSHPIPRLGIPGISMSDAGQAVRGSLTSTQGPATLFPSGITMAATWDKDLLRRIGQATGEEALNKGIGIQVLLTPKVNIDRSPLGGRNGESMADDPYLAGQLGANHSIGMQSTGCAACVKHFACNNEEVDRDFVSVKVDERALREIYLPAFETAVKQGHAWTIVASYNKINGYHATANKYLLRHVLKND